MINFPDKDIPKLLDYLQTKFGDKITISHIHDSILVDSKVVTDSEIKEAINQFIVINYTTEEPKHGQIKHHGYKTTFSETGFSAHTVSVVETYCSHCKEWVRTDGVLGPLTFMARHRDGDCQKPCLNYEPKGSK